jgi:hypothetical protein
LSLPILALLLSISFLSAAQNSSNMTVENKNISLIHEDKKEGQDEIKQEKDYNWKFLLSLDGRRSVVLEETTGIGGLKIGATLNNRYKMGLGIYWMKGDIERVGLPGGNITDAQGSLFYKFGYTSLFFEPVKTLNRKWQLSLPLHIGSAVIERSYLNTAGNKHLFKTSKAPLFEFSIIGQYKFYRWLAMGTGFGYRSLLVDDDKIKRALNAPVYILQIKILFGVIWKTLLNKEIDDGWDD